MKMTWKSAAASMVLVVACGGRQIRTATAEEAECERNLQAIVDRPGTTLEQDLEDHERESERCEALLRGRR